MHGFGHFHFVEVHQEGAFFKDVVTAEEDAFRLGMFQIMDQLDICLSTGTDGAYIIQTETIGCIDGSAADCRQGIQTQLDGLFHHVVQMAVAHEARERYVIGDETDAVL